MELGQKLQMPIRLILACAIFLGVARVHPSMIACSFDLCGTKCPMHKKAEAEPEVASCCAKKKPAEPVQADCKCAIKAGKPATQSVLQAPPVLPSSPAILAEAPVVVLETPVIAHLSIPVPRCHGPPGERAEAPDLGRAPPVL